MRQILQRDSPNYCASWLYLCRISISSHLLFETSNGLQHCWNNFQWIMPNCNGSPILDELIAIKSIGFAFLTWTKVHHSQRINPLSILRRHFNPSALCQSCKCLFVACDLLPSLLLSGASHTCTDCSPTWPYHCNWTAREYLFCSLHTTHF